MQTARMSFLCVALLVIGCKPEPDTTSTSDEQALDFDALLTSVDDVIGRRVQTMQMEGMKSATYQYDGPIETVLDVIAPIAERSGFSEEASALEERPGAAEQDMQDRMGIEVKAFQNRMFTHRNGESLFVWQAHTANNGDEMTLLLIQLMDQREMFDSLDK